MNSNESVMIFTYGMLTSSSIMHLCCGSARGIEVGFLPGFKLVFNNHATLIPQKSQRVYGMTWMVDQNDLANLDRVENYPEYYTRRKLWVYGVSNTAWRCWTYIMNDSTAGAAPKHQYLKCLEFGYQEQKIPWHQVQKAIDTTAKHSTCSVG